MIKIVAKTLYEMRESEMKPQLEEIESVRRRLAEVVAEHQGDLLHPIVIQVSQQLDKYIVNYQNKQECLGH